MKNTGFRQGRVSAVRLVLIALAAGGLWAEFRAPAEAAPPASIVPDTTGAISELLLHFAPASVEELHPLYQDLFASLPPDVGVTVVCPNGEAISEFLLRWGHLASSGGRELNLLDAGMPVTIWARDRTIARQQAGWNGPLELFTPGLADFYDQTKENELLVSEILWIAHLGETFWHSGLRVEGGNIVSNSRHVFIGMNVLSENSRGMDAASTQRLLQTFTGRPYLLIGDAAGRVPWDHLDMYVTPVGSDTILVGSPALGADLAGVPCDEQSAFDSVPADVAACPSDALQARFDDVADQFRSLGYAVSRTPMLCNPQEGWMVTYNNVLIEERAARGIVYMPVYRIPLLDEIAEVIYENLGFEVRTVDVSGIYVSGGALRCVANVLRRRPGVARPTVSAGLASNTWLRSRGRETIDLYRGRPRWYRGESRRPEFGGYVRETNR